MRIGFLAALAAAGAALLFAGAAAAQSLPIPGGSYRSSCSNARALALPAGARLLTAQCRTSSGSLRNSSLRYENCRGDIANNNGNLVCSNNGGPGGGGWERPPSGSYQQSCRNPEVRNGVLMASCQDSRGRWQNSSINVNSCRGRDIANDNGRLSCSGGGGGWERPPSGSYQQSCRNPEVRNGVLSASCQDSRGRWQDSSINVNSCRGRDIANDNGRLSCSGGGNERPPSGSYQQSCRNADVRNGVLSASCQDGRGRWQDSSINVSSCRGRDIANNDGRLTCSSGGGEEPVPNGSYHQTCRDAQVRNGVLTAACRDPNGRWQNSSINVASCRGRDIANDNGRLSCSGGGGGGQIPAGSYQQTCRSITVDGPVLRAQCKLTFGNQYNSTAIDTRICQGRDIYNLNGNLVCDGRAGGR